MSAFIPNFCLVKQGHQGNVMFGTIQDNTIHNVTRGNNHGHDDEGWVGRKQSDCNGNIWFHIKEH